MHKCKLGLMLNICSCSTSVEIELTINDPFLMIKYVM